MSVFWLTTSTSGRLHLVRCRTCLRSTVVSSLREVGAWQRAHDVLVCVDAVRAQRRRGGNPPAPRSSARSPFSNQEENR